MTNMRNVLMLLSLYLICSLSVLSLSVMQTLQVIRNVNAFIKLSSVYFKHILKLLRTFVNSIELFKRKKN